MPTYDSSVPATNHNPSVDQPIMQSNAVAISNIWAVDHYTFDTGSDGKHKQITFPSNVVPSNPTAPASVLYTQLGSAASTQSNVIYKNSNSALTFPISMIRAFGTVIGGVLSPNSFNIASISTSLGNIAVNLTSGCVTGTSYCVIASTTRGTTGGGAKDQITIVYNITSATQFILTMVDVSRNAVTDPSAVSFIILQA